MKRRLVKFLPRALRDSLRESSLIRTNAVRNESFFCAAIAGESDCSVCINSDLTVSCNCRDLDGSGHIGDLNKESLDEIFRGRTVRRFRAMLAANRLPTRTCLHCSELKTMPAREVEPRLRVYRVPDKGIMLENTVLPNQRRAMGATGRLVALRSGKVTLTTAEVERVAILLRQHNVEKLSFFNAGEPFLPDDVLEQVRTIRRYNPGIGITTCTDGEFLDREDRIEAALLMDYVYVSLDRVSAQGAGRDRSAAACDRVYRNIEALVAERDRRGKSTPVVEWKYSLFRWNDAPSQIGKAIDLAARAGIDRIGFYHGEGPLRHRSVRWYPPGFREPGTPAPGGLVVDLQQVGDHLPA